MSKPRHKKKTKPKKTPATPVALEPARAIAPEDVRVDDYVTIARTTIELIPDEIDFKPHVDPVRVTLMSGCAGWPLKVKSVSLPFVMVTDASGEHYPLDLRRHQVARLDARYGRATFKGVARRRKSGK